MSTLLKKNSGSHLAAAFGLGFNHHRVLLIPVLGSLPLEAFGLGFDHHPRAINSHIGQVHMRPCPSFNRGPHWWTVGLVAQIRWSIGHSANLVESVCAALSLAKT